MNILGLSCFYHDAAAVLLQDGDLVAAVEEERFSRVKHDHRFPQHAINYCLSEGGITAQDIDYVLRYDNLESWGRLNDAAVNSPEWNAFIAKAGVNPSAELVSSFSLFNQDPSNMADNFTDPGQVINAFRWKPAAGLEGTNVLRQGFLTAKAIHENLGARVETYEINSSVDVGQMQYLMIYDSYSHMAEVNAAMATDPEWLAFQSSVAAAPEQAATMVWAIVASTIANWD